MQATPIKLDPKMTVLELTDRYPETIDVLVDCGFPRMRDPDKRRTLGKALTLEAAARLRKLDTSKLVGRLASAAARGQAEERDVTLKQEGELTLRPPGDLRLAGLLPCPVRLPILEQVNALADELRETTGEELGYSLAAASVGVDGLNSELARIEEEGQLPDVFISAGFESFFDRKNFARFKDRGTFIDLAPPGQNSCFGDLQLRDPEGHFTMVGMVPAVFLVNGPELGDLPAPRTWQDVLHPRFEGRIALPVGDFDLFNGILLNVYKQFGEEGITALRRNMLVSLHPSQTVGRFSGKKQQQPAISIIPYFFSRMTMGSQVIRVIWPEDGAIICPIFLLVRRASLPEAEPVARLFLRKEVGEVLAHKGLFPVLDPAVDNRLPPGSAFRWLGWDFIHDHDLGELIPRLDALFRQAGPADASTEDEEARP